MPCHEAQPNTLPVCMTCIYALQQATIYYEGNHVVPKEYSFKIQSVSKNSKGEDDRKTIGKVKVRGGSSDALMRCACDTVQRGLRAAVVHCGLQNP